MTEEMKKGHRFAWGAIVAVCEAMILISLVNIALAYFVYPVDSTDKDWWNRSGFELLVDHGTGQEYLKKGSAIIKREGNP